MRKELTTRAHINRGVRILKTLLATPGKFTEWQAVGLAALLADYKRLAAKEQAQREAGARGGRPRHSSPSAGALATRKSRLRATIENPVYATREAAVEAADNAFNDDGTGLIADTEAVETAEGWRVKILWA